MSDQLVRWADTNFDYNDKFINDDEYFISYNEIYIPMSDSERYYEERKPLFGTKL
jgi:hypothetical protein